MKGVFALAVMAVVCGPALSAPPDMISVEDHNGTAYVAGAELARKAAIAIKRLPGSDAVVACSSERCARLNVFFDRDKETLVGIDDLSRVLGLSPRFSDDRRQVWFQVEARSRTESGGPIRVGDLAPNFRLTRLGGGEVALAELRGRRVLINSWASW